MKTLKTLIEQEWEKVVGISYGTDLKGRHYVDLQDLRPVFDSILETIVKESFKNTRVEEREIPDTKIEELTETGKINRAYKVGFNDALSDKHNKENQFLNN